MIAPELAALEKGCAPLGRFLKGDVAAVDCITKLMQVAHILDDLVDKDREPSDDEIVSAFWLALVDVPGNPFFRTHADMLRPVLATSMLNWLAANKMERGGDDADLRIAFVIRSAYVDLVTLSALLVGGLGWANEIAPDIRRWVHAEGFDAYLKNLSAEQEARDVRGR